MKKTHYTKLDNRISKFYYCPLCEFCDSQKVNVSAHIRTHKEEEIKAYLIENDLFGIKKALQSPINNEIGISKGLVSEEKEVLIL